MIYEDGGLVFLRGESPSGCCESTFHHAKTQAQIDGQKNTLKFIDFCLDNGEYLIFRLC